MGLLYSIHLRLSTVAHQWHALGGELSQQNFYVASRVALPWPFFARGVLRRRHWCKNSNSSYPCFVRALPSERIDCVFLSSDRRSPLGSSANWEEVECLVGQHRQPYGCRWDRRADRSVGRRFQNENVEALVGRPGRCRNAWEAAYPFCRNDLDALVRLNEASTRTWPKPCAC